jgi:glyoxylase-like metal-dependent hydrolase (beta-lactamase superfamily II)
MPAPNLTRVSRFGFVNTYLVAEDDGLTLIDTAIPGSAKAILREAEHSAPRSCASR